MTSRTEFGAEGSDSAEGARTELPGLPARYEVIRALGRGSQKSVYLAHDSTLDRPVAIAAIELSRLGAALGERLYEARAMARIGDLPQVVAIYDVLEGPRHLYIVSRYLPGGDLATHLKASEGRVLPVRRAVEIGAQIALALAQAHESGVSHRDVKPGNIFLDARGNAFLGDFGTSMIGGDRERPGEHGLVGTLAYMPPEQAWGASAEPSCDLYALGCVLYELLCGAPPFTGTSPAEVLGKHESETPLAPREWNRSVPVALDDLILTLLAKRPADRPSSSREVHASLQGILRSGLTPAPDSDVRGNAELDRVLLGRSAVSPLRVEPAFVGRRAERAEFETLRREVWQGQTRVLLVCGEGGVGKTRLLREMRARVEAEGGLCLVGQGYEDVPLPYRSFVEALLPLAGRLSEIEAADASALRKLLHLDSTLELASGSPEEAEPQRLFLALSRALAVFASKRPLLLLIDDLHWVDRASLDLFEHLAFALARGGEPTCGRILLIGSHRPVPSDDRTARAIARLEREEGCRSLSIGGFDESGVYDFLTALGIQSPSQQLVRMIEDASGGNPLFVRETVHHLRERRAIAVRGGASVTSLTAADLELPSSLSGAVRGRVTRLPDEPRRLLVLGSLLGHSFEIATLAEVAARDVDSVADELDEAVAAGLLVDEGQTYAFAHPLVRQVCLRVPTPSERQRLHLRLATRLEEMHRSQIDRVAPLIAHHLVRAGPAADPAKVAVMARRAAFQALARSAIHEGVELLEAALASGSRAAAFSAKEIASLHAAAGRAYHKVYERGPCLDHLSAAITGFEAIADEQGLVNALSEQARARLDFGLVTYRHLDDVRDLECALERLGEASPRLRARALGTLALTYWTAQASERAEDLATQAIEIARADGDDLLCSELSCDLALAHLQRLRIRESLMAFREATDRARRAGDLHATAASLRRIPMACYMLGALDEAEGCVERSLEANRRVNSVGEDSFAAALLAMLAVARGEFAAAERFADEALLHHRRSSYPWAAILALVAQSCCWALRGDRAQALATIDRILEPGRIFEDPSTLEPMFQANRWLIDAYAGERPQFAERTDLFLAPPPDETGYDFSMVAPYCYQVELGAIVGPEEVAFPAEAPLRLAEERGIVLSVGWPLLVPRVRGVAATLAGRFDEAEQHFERALAIARRGGLGPEEGRTLLDEAKMLLVRREPGDASRARTLLGEAILLLERFALAPFAAEARRLAEPGPTSLPCAPRASGKDA